MTRAAKHRLVVGFLGLLFCITVASPSAGMTQAAGMLEPPVRQLIVKYRDPADANLAPTAQEALLRAHVGVALEYVRPMAGEAHVLRLPDAVPIAEAEHIAAQLRALPEVEYAEPDWVIQVAQVPNDPRYADQWHYFETYGIGLPQAWQVTTGTTSVVVAVIDTGHRPHPDLASRIVGGYDFISDVRSANDGNGRDADPTDPGDWSAANECYPGSPARNSSWHGTHVAGTIGAVTNNGVGVAGVTWRARLLSVRVLGKCGGTLSDLVDGMYWAAGFNVPGVPPNPTPARVLNLSLGGFGTCGSTLQAAINAINARGGVVVVAAGNANQPAANYQPASCSGVIVVGATNRSGVRAWYSNYGSAVDISAPGGDSAGGILSTANDGATFPGADSYRAYIGTSMATPHVAGTAALMLGVNPQLNAPLVEWLLRKTAKPFGPGHTCTGETSCGTGIVDARAAVLAAQRVRNTFLPIVQR